MPPVVRRLADFIPPVPVPAIPRPRWTPPVAQPPPPIAAHRLVQFVLEVLDGRRPVTQLGVVSDLAVVERLRDRVRVRATQLVTVRVSHPARHAAEISATVRRGSRVFAVAARADLRNERWWLTQFTVLE